MSSQAGIEESGGKVAGAQTDHEAVLRLLTTGDASCEHTKFVDQGAKDTGGDNNVLFWVLVVDEGAEVIEESRNIAESVGDVKGLNKLSLCNGELGRLAWIPDLIVVPN